MTLQPASGDAAAAFHSRDARLNLTPHLCPAQMSATPVARKNPIESYSHHRPIERVGSGHEDQQTRDDALSVL